MRRLALLPVFLLLCAALSAQSVTVKDTVMRTYGYSDPDPVPRTGRIYPYHRYQSFALEGEDRLWKMGVRQNAYKRGNIYPQNAAKNRSD